MNASFHTGNRKRLYEAMKPASLLVMFSGEDVRKTNDEYYPFYTDRNFYYLTGLDQHELVLMAVKEPSGNVHEQIYILPPDLMAERWTGARLKPAEVEALSGISDVRFVDQFQTDFHALAAGGHYSLTSGQIAQVYLDLFRVSPQDIDRPAHRLLKQIQANYPYLQVENANAILRRLRLIKQPCEIDAINGVVCHFAQKTGVSAPFNAKIVEIIHRIEKNKSSCGYENIAEFDALLKP